MKVEKNTVPVVKVVYINLWRFRRDHRSIYRLTYRGRDAQQESKISEVRTLADCCRRVAANSRTVTRRPFTTSNITNTYRRHV